MASVTKSLTILLVLAVAMLKACKASIFHRRVTVQIINNLVHHEDLIVHCKSKDDDLGEHTLIFGKDYEFSFSPNFVWTVTLFFCSFKWSEGVPYYFDIYVQARDEGKCKVCSWKIWEGGPCRYDDKVRGYGRCYPWNYSPYSLTIPLPLAPSINITNSSSL